VARSLVASVLLPALLLTACSGVQVRRTDDRPAESASASTREPEVDLRRARVPRTDFCSVLSEEDVATALGGPVVGTAHYGNGDRFEVRPGYVDVSHEYGCVFEGRAGTTAKAWVFARPVAGGEARMLVRRVRRQRGCSFPDPGRFGRPGVSSVCEVAGARGSTPAVRARLEGRFGDSWLACEVAGPSHRSSGSSSDRTDLVHRAEKWCGSVVRAVSEST
jgi:hypothetical protein